MGSKGLGQLGSTGLGQLGGKRSGQNQRGIMNRGVRDRNPVDRQRGPLTGLGITAPTPTPRAVIAGTEGQAGSRKRESETEGTGSSGQTGCKEMTQGVLGETDTEIL